MSNRTVNLMAEPESTPSTGDPTFAEMLSSFEQKQTENESLSGTVVAVNQEQVLVDIGRKTEGALSVRQYQEAVGRDPQMGDSVLVLARGRNAEGYYDLSTVHVERPKDWTALQSAFDGKRVIAGTVVEQIKGGFQVDIGVRAFLPASRSGARDTEEVQQLVGQEIQCRITKLDTEKEDIVVDRRSVLEEEQTRRKEETFAGLREGAVMRGRVRNVMDFGAFVDLGGIDGLLHVTDLSWSRVAKASDVVAVGSELDVKVLKIDPATRKISLGVKQLSENPWSVAATKFQVGERVAGTVVRLTDFGAFVELIPGVDGLIHLSEMSWDRKVRKPGDLLKIGDRVDVVVLQLNATERKIGLGLKQALGDPWEAVPEKYPVGSVVEGPVTNLTNFGAFVDLGDGIEGMIHISDITHEKRVEHPREHLAKGQTVKTTVLELDRERRRIRLGMKQLEPTSVDHFIAEHQVGNSVTGRIVEVKGNKAKVELGEGVHATCELQIKKEQARSDADTRVSDVSSLSAMLAAKWKQGGGQEASAGQGEIRPGQIRSFRILSLDQAQKQIVVELAG